ncbi:MAG TPA: hypothetical protein VHB72_01510 [Candidatus Saccharimonadales bacterium]|nr:hypothetical protein [Candidatus Saccharimonadales bacterium]
MAGERVISPGIIANAAELLKVPEAEARDFFDTLYDDTAVWLPPRELWRASPNDPIETPVDDRGIVDVPKLIGLVKDSVEPEYVWQLPDNTHHFYWYAARYSYDDKWTSDKKHYSAGRFRDLSIHKAELPREFENWLHLITLPPPVPSREVMQYRIDSWRVAVNLFGSVRRVVMWEKRAQKRANYTARNPDVVSYDEGDIFGEEYMETILDRQFRGVERHMSELEQVPPEFRLVQPANTPKELATQLGRIVGKRSLKLRQAVNGQSPLLVAA